jgi:hypothetical protein
MEMRGSPCAASTSGGNHDGPRLLQPFFLESAFAIKCHLALGFLFASFRAIPSRSYFVATQCRKIPNQAPTSNFLLTIYPLAQRRMEIAAVCVENVTGLSSR